MISVSVKNLFFALLVFALSSTFSFAAPLEVPPLAGRVVDNANMISESGRAKVSAAILRLEKVTGGQMAVLTMPSLKGDALEDFSMRVAENWKIGRKGKDNGIILLLVKDSREIRLEVGYGWEGLINDARAGDIIREMVSIFKAGKIDDGIVFAVLQVTNIVSGKASVGTSDKKTDKRKNSDSLSTGLLVCIVVIIFISGFFRRRYYGNTYYGGGGGGGGFSGGGGSFGGGGASGRW